MIDELEALVGHVFIVGGRAVSTTPPGALVELPLKKTQRGREQDTFFTLVTPAGQAQGQAIFYEQLARQAAEIYFHSTGSVTSGLREAVTSVNSQLLEHNKVSKQRYEANIACLVLRGHEVYMARSGACIALLRQENTFTTFPEELREEYILNSNPLGRNTVLDIKLSRHEISPGHILALTDSGFLKADRDKLNIALGGGSIPAVIELLKPLGEAQSQAMIIEFTSANAPDPTVLTPLPGTKIMRSSTLNLPKPVSTPVPKSTPISRQTGPIELAPRPSTPIKSTPAPQNPGSEPDVPNRAKSQRVPDVTPNSTLVKAVDTPNDVGTANTASKPSASSASQPMKKSVPVPEAKAEAQKEIVSGKPNFLIVVLQKLWNILKAIFRLFGSLLNRLLPEPTESGPRVPSMLAAGLAVLVPMIIVFVVVALRLSQADLTQFERLLSEIQKVAQQAESIPATDIKTSKTAWLGVLQRIDQVETSTGRSNDPVLDRIRQEAQNALDNYSRVTRRNVQQIRTFSSTAKLTGPVIEAQAEVYTLDTTTNSIYRDTLAYNGKVIPKPSTNPIVTQGQAVSAYSVGHLTGLLWMSQGGTQNKNVIASLDIQRGLLINYSPTFAPAIAQRIAGSDVWEKPVAIRSWRDRLYILDPGANQIWRYKPLGASYPDTPTPYFDDTTAHELSTAVDFDIDTIGNVFILFGDGSIKRYNAGVAVPFSYSDLPEDGIKSANAMFMDLDAKLLYLVDSRDQSIFVVTFAGKFKYRFKSNDPAAFRQLTGVFADHSNVYVVSGPAMYYFTTDDLPNFATDDVASPAATPTP